MNPESTGTSQPQPQFPKGPLAPPTLRERLQRLTKTRLVVGGLLALVLITGLIVYVVNQNTFKPATGDPSRTAQVTITDNGFSPATLHVALGTQVTWTNNGKTVYQVASDPHPAHNSISGFKSDIKLMAGDSYSFIFEKSGTYHYHDEQAPLKRQGTVIVD
jgi:plastocyanin